VLAFLADIKEQPADDAPRLIFADWLEEQGDPELAARGELLRLQCRTPRTEASRARQAELLGQFSPRWLGPLVAVVRSWGWHRGLLRIAADADVLLADPAPALAPEAFAWVESLELDGLQVPQVRRLAALPWLSQVATLVLECNRIGDAGVEALTASPHLGNLRGLFLRSNDVGDIGAAALACAPSLTNLAVLSLVNNRITDAGAQALADSPHLTRLSSLNVDGNDFGPAGARALKAVAAARQRLWLHLGTHWRG
jgi:uncharacterized protein (TIGR02996 family)